MPQRPIIAIIAIIGGGTATRAQLKLARETARLLAQRRCILLTGGRSGIMAAASRGASEAGGLTLAILPGESATQANRYVHIPIVTGLGEARNVIIARTAQALIAIGGEFGTLSEIAFALKFEKPVIALRSPWAKVHPAIRTAASPAEAVRLAVAASKTTRR
jgi:uncharacterized protein (TIGR00725 family)